MCTGVAWRGRWWRSSSCSATTGSRPSTTSTEHNTTPSVGTNPTKCDLQAGTLPDLAQISHVILGFRVRPPLSYGQTKPTVDNKNNKKEHALVKCPQWKVAQWNFLNFDKYFAMFCILEILGCCDSVLPQRRSQSNSMHRRTKSHKERYSWNCRWPSRLPRRRRRWWSWGSTSSARSASPYRGRRQYFRWLKCQSAFVNATFRPIWVLRILWNTWVPNLRGPDVFQLLSGGWPIFTYILVLSCARLVT